MSQLDHLIRSIGDREIPPVEDWDPDYCGSLDILIKADGSWLYQGSALSRQKIKHLFSRVLKKENDQYFLVTPVEKVSIQVEWQPFVMVDFQIIQHQGQAVYQFEDNFGDRLLLTETSQLKLSDYSVPGQPIQQLPIINVRRNLFAGFSRACYYRLLESATINQHNDQNQVEIQSKGLTFCIGQY